MSLEYRTPDEVYFNALTASTRMPVAGRLPCAKAIAISAASSRSGRRTCECVEIRLVRGEVLKGHTVELSPTAPSSTDVVASFDAGEADARVTEDLGEPGGDVVDDLSWRRASARGNVAT